MKRFNSILIIGLTTAAVLAAQAQRAPAEQTGNVIFFHSDGAGLNHWNALRIYKYGPDGTSHWDRLPAMAVYTGHMKDGLTATSHGGATTHAYGVKVRSNSFGLDGDEPIMQRGQRKLSLMQEAVRLKKGTALIQTGHIAEPGTAAFVASVARRNDYCEIARQVIESGVDVIMAGGEQYLLPKDGAGRHNNDVECEYSTDLIERARSLGYTVVYTREELLAVDPAKTNKLLGVFARRNTFHDQTEEKNREEKKGHYVGVAPTIAEMADVALKIVSRNPNGFFMVAEEEGTDNFGNVNNAAGMLEALSRADDAVGVFRAFVAQNPNTLLLMAADSDAGGMQLIGSTPSRMKADEKLPEKDENGAPVDGCEGTGSLPFMSARPVDGTVKPRPAPCRPEGRAEAFAKREQFPFAITWATRQDTYGAILARAEGLNADLVKGTVDNTQIYEIMRRTLFGAASQ